MKAEGEVMKQENKRGIYNSLIINEDLWKQDYGHKLIIYINSLVGAIVVITYDWTAGSYKYRVLNKIIAKAYLARIL